MKIYVEMYVVCVSEGGTVCVCVCVVFSLIPSVDLQTEYIWHHTYITTTAFETNAHCSFSEWIRATPHFEIRCLYNDWNYYGMNGVADDATLPVVVAAAFLFPDPVNIIETFSMLHSIFPSLFWFYQPICSNHAFCMICIVVCIKVI